MTSDPLWGQGWPIMTPAFANVMRENSGYLSIAELLELSHRIYLILIGGLGYVL